MKSKIVFKSYLNDYGLFLGLFFGLILIPIAIILIASMLSSKFSVDWILKFGFTLGIIISQLRKKIKIDNNKKVSFYMGLFGINFWYKNSNIPINNISLFQLNYEKGSTLENHLRLNGPKDEIIFEIVSSKVEKINKKAAELSIAFDLEIYDLREREVEIYKGIDKIR